MTWRVSLLQILIATVLVPLAAQVRAELTIVIQAEVNLDGAVLVATAKDGDPLHSVPSGEATMMQTNRQFDPFILPVPLNVPVSFPNRDDTAHHVYSFSAIGTFELPLYKGDSPNPITFTEAGVVPIGCNIHDWMIGYIYVVDSPFYTQIQDGSGRFDNLPTGSYEFSLWHPALEGQPAPTWQVDVPANGHMEILELNRQIAEVVQPQPPKERFDEQWDY